MLVTAKKCTPFSEKGVAEMGVEKGCQYSWYTKTVFCWTHLLVFSAQTAVQNKKGVNCTKTGFYSICKRCFFGWVLCCMFCFEWLVVWCSCVVFFVQILLVLLFFCCVFGFVANELKMLFFSQIFSPFGWFCCSVWSLEGLMWGGPLTVFCLFCCLLLCFVCYVCFVSLGLFCICGLGCVCCFRFCLWKQKHGFPCNSGVFFCVMFVQNMF